MLLLLSGKKFLFLDALYVLVLKKALKCVAAIFVLADLFIIVCLKFSLLCSVAHLTYQSGCVLAN